LTIFLRGIKGSVIAVHPDEPYQSATMTRVELLGRLVVADECDGVGEGVAGLPLSPLDRLENVGAGDVVGVGRAQRQSAPLPCR